MLDRVGNDGEHGPHLGRGAPQLISERQMGALDDPRPPRPEILPGIVLAECVEIDDLRSLVARNTQDLTLVHDAGSTPTRRHDEVLDRLSASLFGGEPTVELAILT
jgi:hypothetical protein